VIGILHFCGQKSNFMEELLPGRLQKQSIELWLILHVSLLVESFTA